MTASVLFSDTVTGLECNCGCVFFRADVPVASTLSVPINRKNGVVKMPKFMELRIELHAPQTIRCRDCGKKFPMPEGVELVGEY